MLKIIHYINHTLDLWYNHHKVKYRFFKLRELQKDKTVGSLEICREAIYVLEGYQYPDINPVILKRYSVSSKIPNAMELLSLLKQVKVSLVENQTAKYNTRIIADGYGELNVFEWLWRPVLKEGLSVESLIIAINNQFKYLLNCAEDRNNSISPQYIERSIRPLVDIYISLIDIIETIYINQESEHG